MVSFADGFEEEITREALRNLQERYDRVHAGFAGKPADEVRRALVAEMDGAIATEDLESSVAAISQGERVVVVHGRA